MSPERQRRLADPDQAEIRHRGGRGFHFRARSTTASTPVSIVTGSNLRNECRRAGPAVKRARAGRAVCNLSRRPAAARLNAPPQGPYRRWSWKIPREPPACREVFVLAGFQRVRRPSRFPRVPCGPGAASAPLAEGRCGRCCGANRPAPYRQLDRPALPQMKASRSHTVWPEECA